ncbi:MAG: hypothetical protein K6E62_11765 [Lachnospiraceae bacterium]|nr:hypothetical protein [Lachnospiraceae bacterium]
MNIINSLDGTAGRTDRDLIDRHLHAAAGILGIPYNSDSITLTDGEIRTEEGCAYSYYDQNSGEIWIRTYDCANRRSYDMDRIVYHGAYALYHAMCDIKKISYRAKDDWLRDHRDANADGFAFAYVEHFFPHGSEHKKDFNLRSRFDGGLRHSAAGRMLVRYYYRIALCDLTMKAADAIRSRSPRFEDD